MKIIVGLVLFVLTTTSAGQESGVWWENLAAGESPKAEELDAGLAWLIELMQNPVDINKASAEALAVIPGLYRSFIDSILKYRARRSITSLEEIRRHLGLDPDQWSWLAQFLRVAPNRNQRLRGEARVRWSHPLEPSRGFAEGRFAGHRGKVYQRYRIRRGDNLSLLTLLEKDSGESSYADHWIFSLARHWDQGKTKVILGDFLVDFGLGLLLSPPYSAGKGQLYPFKLRDRSRVIRSNGSAYEGGLLRGLAAQKTWGQWFFAGWISRQRLDATKTHSGQIATLLVSGLHRTGTERAHAGTGLLGTQGGILGRRLPHGSRVGAAIFQTTWSPALAPDRQDPQAWRSPAQRSRYWALHARYQVGLLSTFAEMAWQDRAFPAWLLGGAWDLPGLTVFALGRRYSPLYRNVFARGYGEQNETRNEAGWTLAVTHRPRRGSTLTFWFDQFTTLWRTFAHPRPQRGAELYLQWREKVNSEFWLTLRYTTKTRREVGSDPGKSLLYQKPLWPASIEKLRIQFRFRPKPTLALVGRIDHSRHVTHNGPYDRRAKGGWLLSWDIRRSAPPRGLLVGARLAYFDAEDFSVRLYQFEQDLPGVMRSILLSGQGTRFYLYWRTWINTHLSISVKYSATSYWDREVIGSGLDAVAAPSKHDLSLQLDWTY